MGFKKKIPVGLQDYPLQLIWGASPQLNCLGFYLVS